MNELLNHSGERKATLKGLIFNLASHFLPARLIEEAPRLYISHWLESKSDEIFII